MSLFWGKSGKAYRWRVLLSTGPPRLVFYQVEQWNDIGVAVFPLKDLYVNLCSSRMEILTRTLVECTVSVISMGGSFAPNITSLMATSISPSTLLSTTLHRSSSSCHLLLSTGMLETILHRLVRQLEDRVTWGQAGVTMRKAGSSWGQSGASWGQTGAAYPTASPVSSP